MSFPFFGLVYDKRQKYFIFLQQLSSYFTLISKGLNKEGRKNE